MLGDVLRENLSRLINTTTSKVGENAFYVVLKEIAVQEILEHGSPIDSDTIIPLYYNILHENIDFIPDYFKEVLPSNKQERFRVIVRNIFSSNAFHTDGIANHKEIYAYKRVNENKKGGRIVYKKR